MIPKENREIFELLYKIEVGLREFIIEVLEEKDSPKWWKQRLPSDVRDSSNRGIAVEKAAKWSELVPHHLIYYTDFPDLKKIITRADNWRDAFQEIFQRKDIIATTLSELEPIRNKIAHNRKATHADLSIVGAAYRKIVSSIGEERFVSLVTRCTLAEGIDEVISRLHREAVQAYSICKNYQLLDELKYWQRVRNSWWFDSDYLEHEINGIEAYFKALLDYRQLPRFRGSGYQIESWVQSENINEKYAKAISEFEQILPALGDS